MRRGITSSVTGVLVSAATNYEISSRDNEILHFYTHKPRRGWMVARKGFVWGLHNAVYAAMIDVAGGW